MDKITHIKNRISKLSMHAEQNRNIINKLNRKLRRMMSNA